jgi:AbrB family looped-hinge helix DNA binding protein
MDGVVEFKVSTSGQMSLPAEVRHRWQLDGGGRVEVIDLGWGVLVAPLGTGVQLRRELLPTQEEHAAFIAELDDPDLMTT